MDKKINKDILGRFVVAALVAYFIFRYNYEVTQLIYSGRDFITSIQSSISTYLERTSDDSGLFISLILLIVYIVWAIIQILILLVGGFILWVLVILNDAYILPFIIPLFIVYSEFSYSFIVKPILWLPNKIFDLLIKLGKYIFRLSNLFIVLPMAEVISLKNSGKNKIYKIGMTFFFVFGLCAIVIGGVGLSIKVIQDKHVIASLDSAITDNFSGIFKQASYENVPYQTTVLATTPNWTSVGIQLKKGDVVSFTATGRIKCISPFKPGMSITNPMGLYLFNGYVTPDRLTKSYRRQGFSSSYYILTDENINCLMGKVGIEEAFAIGSSKTYKVKQGGILFLGINQLWKSGKWKNNQGQFDVNIMIRRKV